MVPQLGDEVLRRLPAGVPTVHGGLVPAVAGFLVEAFGQEAAQELVSVCLCPPVQQGYFVGTCKQVVEALCFSQQLGDYGDFDKS